MKRSLILFLLFFSVSLASAWNEPAGFRDIPWGASPDLVRQRIPSLYCAPSTHTCSGYVMIGDIRVFTMMQFESGGMDIVALRFPTEHFTTMKSIFIARYGQPHVRSMPTVQNHMGAQFVNETLDWQGPRVSITLKQYGTELTHSSGILMTKEHVRAHQEHKKQKVNEGKKDL